MEISLYKKDLVSRLLELAKNKKDASRKTSQAAQERANEAEGPMQSRYSTFKEEGQYLAGGLAILHEEFKSTEAIIKLILNEPIKSSARVRVLSIVEIEFDDESTAKFFILPVLGGERIDDFTVITLGAPLCRAIINKETGDQFNFKIGNKLKKGEIINVQ